MGRRRRASLESQSRENVAWICAAFKLRLYDGAQRQVLPEPIYWRNL